MLCFFIIQEKYDLSPLKKKTLDAVKIVFNLIWFLIELLILFFSRNGFIVVFVTLYQYNHIHPHQQAAL